MLSFLKSVFGSDITETEWIHRELLKKHDVFQNP